MLAISDSLLVSFLGRKSNVKVLPIAMGINYETRIILVVGVQILFKCYQLNTATNPIL